MSRRIRFESSLPDTPNGKGVLLLATALTMEGLPASTKVVEPSTRRVKLEGRELRSSEAGDLCPNIHNGLHFLMSVEGNSGPLGMDRRDNGSN